jgi:hypothetical protein
MVIDQRNAGASVTPTDGSFVVDRYKFGVSQASKFTAQQNAGSVTPPAGFTNYLGLTSSSSYSIVAGDYFNFNQRIEGYNIADLMWGTANAKTVTLSFWVRSSLTGNFGGAVSNNASNRSYPFTYTISAANTWEQKSVTIAGDTSGTWATNNTIGILLSFGFGVGSTYSGTAGTWAGAYYLSATGATSVVGTDDATFYITGVQLEVGTQATSFEYRQYQQELALCQRYYQKTYDINVTPGTNTSVGYWYVGSYAQTSTITSGANWRFPVEMRASPTATAYTSTGTAGSLLYAFLGSSGIGAVTEFAKGTKSVSFYHNGTASGMTAGDGISLAGHIVVSSEL